MSKSLETTSIKITVTVMFNQWVFKQIKILTEIQIHFKVNNYIFFIRIQVKVDEGRIVALSSGGEGSDIELK